MPRLSRARVLSFNKLASSLPRLGLPGHDCYIYFSGGVYGCDSVYVVLLPFLIILTALSYNALSGSGPTCIICGYKSYIYYVLIGVNIFEWREYSFN